MARYNKMDELATLFGLWLIEPQGGNGFSDTQFYLAAERGQAKATCLLDYLMVWLLETDDALRIGDFQCWKTLIAQICAAYEEEDDRSVYIYFEQLANTAAGGAGILNLQLPLVDESNSVTHPAIDGILFDTIVLRDSLQSGLVDGLSTAEVQCELTELTEMIREDLVRYYGSATAFLK